MEVKQIAELINSVTSEVIGEEALQTEDLSNIVDIGNSVFNANAVDNYVRSLVDHIGKVVFVNRPYSGRVPSVLMDGWEFGSVLEKVTMSELPAATENESWELTDGASYDPNVFYKPKVEAKFYNKRVTFEVPISITERQVKSAFSNAEQLNAFISMIYSAVDKSMTVKLDSLVMRTINNMIGETLASDYVADPSTGYDFSAGSGVKAVNLLYKYNNQFNKSITADDAMTDPEFIRYASREMGLYSNRLGTLSTLFNIGGKDRFTSADMLHVVLLNDFAKSADSYLQSDTYHDEFTRLPKAEVVPFWQGSGTSYSFADVSKIDIKTVSEAEISLSGIIGVMFDRDALGVSNLDRRTTTNYNPKGEFYNNWFKMDAGYFNDMNENFIVFFVA